MSSVLERFKKARRVIKEKGVKYLYNRLWMQTFYTSEGRLRDLLYCKIYPLIDYAPYPRMLEIELTTRCNLRCAICEHTYWDEPSRDMGFQQVKSIIDQFPKLIWIAFTGIGENFLHKDFLQLYEYLKKKWPWIFIELYDTFYFIDEENGRRLLDLGIDKVIVSFDAATKGTYERLRVGSDFDRVRNNLGRFIAMKKERGTMYPDITFHYIINKSNVGEVLPYIELVKSLGGEEIFFTQMLHRFKEVEHLAMDVSGELKRKVNERAKELGVRVSWNEDTRAKKKPLHKCNFWIMPFVYVSGHVVPCCAMNEGNVRQFQKENSLGNVFEQSFRQIWFGEKFKEFRRNLRKGKAHPLCFDCPIFDVKDENNA